MVFVAILTTLMIPTEMLVIPWYVMAKTMGWLDTYWGIMFPGLITGFGTFLMRQFFDSVPDDLLAAARIDGLNEFQIWWQVAMPLVMPVRPTAPRTTRMTPPIIKNCFGFMPIPP